MTAPRTVGGRFDFDDGGTYCGGWEDGKAHGHGVCTGPKGQGEYSGSWHFGFEVSGVYAWPSGSAYEGQWQNGKRHGLGSETRGRWIYRGEWTQGFKGRYGVRQSLTSGAKYEGTWANGLQDGYGSEAYADGGVYQGQWMRGMRHGYGVRSSAPFGLASHYRPKNIRASLTSLRSEHVDPASERDRKIDDCRGGFVLKSRSDEPPPRRRSLAEKSTNLKRSILQGLRIKKQRSTGDIGSGGSIRSTGSTVSSASSESSHSGLTRNSAHTDSNVSFVSQDDVTDANVVETYMGEWKNDKRCGYGIAERADGLKYEGEWYGNKKYGYGVTSFKDGTREEGKYKNNVLVTSGKKKHLFLLRSAKFRERVQSAVGAAVRASQIALQKADIAISRTATARGKAEQADVGAMHAREDSDIARLVAKQFAPEFSQPGSDDLLKRKLVDHQSRDNAVGSMPRRSAEEPRYGSQEGPYERFRGGAHEKAPESPGGGAPTNYLDPSSASGASLHLRPQPRHYTLQQAMNDHFDQYRAAGGVAPPREAPVVLPAAPPGLLRYGPDCTPDSGVSESMDAEDASPTRPNRRSTLPNLYGAENCAPQTDSLLSFAPASDSEETTSDDTSAPQRSASLHHVPPPRRAKPPQANPAPKRKKSLPDIAVAAAKVMSREEVAALSSMRREQLRRQHEESERLRANPLLYLLNPDVKDWFSRQQLVMLVLVINISLAIMFFKLLT